MEQLDWLFLIIIGIGFLVGVFKGFINQIVSIVFVIVGIVVAKAFAPSLAAMFDDNYSNVAYGASFAVIFLAVLILGVLLGKLIKMIVHSADLGWLNRLAGGFLGGFKYLIVIGLVINLMEIVEVDKKVFPKDFRSKSMIYEPSKKSLGMLMPFYEEVSSATSEFIEKSGLKDKL